MVRIAGSDQTTTTSTTNSTNKSEDEGEGSDSPSKWLVVKLLSPDNGDEGSTAINATVAQDNLIRIRPAM